MLTTKKLSYICHKEEEEYQSDSDDDDDSQTSYLDVKRPSSYHSSKDTPKSELHFGETWFHGRLKVSKGTF